jgi:hypothetical protein
LAGFQVITIGRFWVIPEDKAERHFFVDIRSKGGQTADGREAIGNSKERTLDRRDGVTATNQIAGRVTCGGRKPRVGLAARLKY